MSQKRLYEGRRGKGGRREGEGRFYEVGRRMRMAIKEVV